MDFVTGFVEPFGAAACEAPRVASSMSFVVFVLEAFPPLACGGTAIVVPDMVRTADISLVFGGYRNAYR